MSDFDPLAHLKGLCEPDEGLGIDELDDDWEEVESGSFEQDGKYQYSTDIVKHIPSGRHFAIHNSRSGSYHSDWYYNQPEVNEVERKEVVVTKVNWVVKK